MLYSIAWWWQPHYLSAAIAEKRLSSDQNELLQSYLSFPRFGKSTVSSVATWADDVRDANGLASMISWHYNSIPLKLDGYQGPVKSLSYGVSNILESCWKTLTDKTTQSKWAISFQLRNLIHFVGDVHTPHHNVEMYNPDFQTGDLGGTLYLLSCLWGSGCLNMHFLWDCAGYLYPDQFPMAGPVIEQFYHNVSVITSEYPESKYGNNKEWAPRSWSNESYEIVGKYGYSIQLYTAPTPDYLEIIRKQSKQRIAQAGYRLGEALKEIISKQTDWSIQHESDVTISEIAAWSLDSVLIVVLAVLIYRIMSIKNVPFLYEQVSTL